MVNINTHVRNVEGVNDLGRMVIKQLAPLGFNNRTFTQAETGNVLLLSNSDGDDYDVLIVHNLDGSTPFREHSYYRDSQHKLFGTGVWFPKGGLVVAIYAMRALRFIRALRKAKIGILLTTDDTLQGQVSGRIVKEISSKARYVLGVTGGMPRGTVVTSRSGASVYNCHVNLVKAESASEVPEATARFIKSLLDITRLAGESDDVLINPRQVDISSDIMSRYLHGEASISLRFNSEREAETFHEKINKLINKARSERVHIQVSGAVRRNPMPGGPSSDELYALARQVAGSLDLRAEKEHRWSSSNICFAESGKPILDGLGPLGASPGDGDEYIIRHSLQDRAALLALLIYELTKKR
jgi:D-alanine-D-alanine ligase